MLYGNYFDEPSITKSQIDDGFQMRVIGGPGITVSTPPYDSHTTVGISSHGAKPGQVMVADGKGGFDWKDPLDVFAYGDDSLRIEIPAVEDAYQAMVDSIKSYNMIAKLYRESKNV